MADKKPQKFEIRPIPRTHTYTARSQFKYKTDDVIRCPGPKATSPHKPALIFPHLCNPPLHICHNHRTKDNHPNLSTLSKITDPATTPSESYQPSSFNLKPEGWDFHSWLKQPDTFLIRNPYSHVWYFASVLLP